MLFLTHIANVEQKSNNISLFIFDIYNKPKYNTYSQILMTVSKYRGSHLSNKQKLEKKIINVGQKHPKSGQNSLEPVQNLFFSNLIKIIIKIID